MTPFFGDHRGQFPNQTRIIRVLNNKGDAGGGRLLFTKSVVHQDLFDGYLCNLRPTGIGGQF
jgi:hypothetical protein